MLGALRLVGFSFATTLTNPWATASVAIVIANVRKIHMVLHALAE
jgi:hypothetical protein